MLRQLKQRKLYNHIEWRKFSSDGRSSFLSALLTQMGKYSRSAPEQSQPVEEGSSRYWELGNPKNRYACMGAMGPISLDELPNFRTNISRLIDFNNKDYNKVHINVLKCPRLLADKIMNVFPALNIRKENLKLIKLSYNNYTDQNRGQLDCLIVVNHILKRLNEDGEFGFYSGATFKNSTNGIYFHIHKTFNVNKDNINDLHVTVFSKDGYLNISNLQADDVGVIYTDCDFEDVQSFTQMLKKMIEREDL